MPHPTQAQAPSPRGALLCYYKQYPKLLRCSTHCNKFRRFIHANAAKRHYLFTCETYLHLLRHINIQLTFYVVCFCSEYGSWNARDTCRTSCTGEARGSSYQRMGNPRGIQLPWWCPRNACICGSFLTSGPVRFPVCGGWTNPSRVSRLY